LIQGIVIAMAAIQKIVILMAAKRPEDLLSRPAKAGPPLATLASG